MGGQPSGYYPAYGAPVAATAQGRKRRSADEQCYLEDGSRCPRGPDGELGHGRKRAPVTAARTPMTQYVVIPEILNVRMTTNVIESDVKLKPKPVLFVD